MISNQFPDEEDLFAGDVLATVAMVAISSVVCQKTFQNASRK